MSRKEYHPFGETSFGSHQKQRYCFCGKELDEESGLYYYGMRYYAPWICRFVSVDPLAAQYAFYTPYQYAGNRPVNFIDLDGAEPLPRLPPSIDRFSHFGRAQWQSSSRGGGAVPFLPTAHPHTPLGILNRELALGQTHWRDERIGVFLHGAWGFTTGTIGASASLTYIAGSEGAGAAFGGATALQ